MKKYTLLLLVVILFSYTKSFSQGTYTMCSTATSTQDSTGTLYDSGGPFGTYQVNEDCSLLIAPANFSIITLTFLEFATENGFDLFKVYDGNTTSSPEIFNRSGSTLPPPVVATSGYMLIVWHSDISIVDSGFACTWTAVQCNCDLITGIVYNDLNGNCVADSGEGLANVPVNLSNSNIINSWRRTDANGHYSLMAPIGTTSYLTVNSGASYDVRYSPTCPLSGTLSATAPSSGNDFGLECLPGSDLTGHLTGWRMRPGFTGTICGFFNNRRCVSPSGQIVLVFDSNLTPLPDTMGIGYLVSGQTVTYPIGANALQWTFCIQVQVSAALSIGDPVCVEMRLEPVATDEDSLDNVQTFCFPVVNSFDPNDKSVSPAGEGSSGYIKPNTALTYTIRFQNTGNASAYNIRVTDTLSAFLDISSLEIIASSHPMNWTCDNRILTFTYDNIMLPDSATNELNSHGYVVFRIKPLATASHLSEIANMASIYFDFNQPIFTNYTTNTIDFYLSNDKIDQAETAFLYPNPADGRCLINFKDESYRTISVISISGQTVGSYVSQSRNFMMDTKFLSNGLYFVTVINSNGAVSVLKMAVTH